MLWFEVLCVAACLFLGIAAFGLFCRNDLSLPGFFLAVLAGGALLAAIIVPAVVYPSRSVGRTTCRHWAQQTGYRTKFTILSWANGGTCLALAPNGRWVKNTQIFINTPSR